MVNRQLAKTAKVVRPVKAFILHWLRFTIVFHEVHVLGMDNGVADALSQFQDN